MAEILLVVGVVALGFMITRWVTFPVGAVRRIVYTAVVEESV
ncbi:hypothetical protein [Halorubrum sp. JWXQ-INN 858]|nr:hypothetical protein [Halorubrum sp. JWXQ-INN 858]